MRLIKPVLIAIIVLLPLSGFSQDSPALKKRKRELEKKEQQRESEDQANEKELIKLQYKSQSKETRKRMKRTKRKSKRLAHNKREFFLKRWLVKSKGR